MQPLYHDSEFNSSDSKKLLPLLCLECGTTFCRSKKDIQSAMWYASRGKRKHSMDFCSPKCSASHSRSNTPDQVPCDYCGKMFKITAGSYNRSKHHFCSRSCAAFYNNANKPKKVKTPCSVCGKPIARPGKTKMCRSCFHQSVSEISASTTKGEIRERRRHYQSFRNSIRVSAQKSFIRSGRRQVCSICGYDKHVDVAHIKPVSEFPDTATIMEINHPDNLTPLCPNHHWEYDHGMIELVAGGGIEPPRSFDRQLMRLER